MIFENLNVKRIIMHEVYKRGVDRQPVSPLFGSSCENLDVQPLAFFQTRITEAMSSDIKGMKLEIRKTGPDSFISHCLEILDCGNEAEFIQSSKSFATLLTDAQTAISHLGGMLVVFDGTIGDENLPFVATIKAEMQSGFRRSDLDGKSKVEFLDKIFLTPATRLYKIGMMVAENKEAPDFSGWSSFVFDSNITKSNRDGAANYFYERYLGCVIPSDGARETVKFFDTSKAFIKTAPIDASRKRDLIDSLHVFVRDENSVTFTSKDFSNRYMPDELKQGYDDFLERKKVSNLAIARDISMMGNRLARRRYSFGNEITLTASPEAMRDKVQIETRTENQGTPDEAITTLVTIKGQMTNTE